MPLNVWIVIQVDPDDKNTLLGIYGVFSNASDAYECAKPPQRHTLDVLGPFEVQ